MPCRTSNERRHQAGDRDRLAGAEGAAGPYDSTVFSQLLEKEIARSRFRNHQFTLMVAEIDGSEEAMLGASANQQEGRIRILFEAVKRHIRPGDYVGHTDSEQLSVILPETTYAEARHMCETISSMKNTGLSIILTAVSFPGDAADAEGLVHSAKTVIRKLR